VVVVAEEESRALGHDHIGTEHLLLGLTRVHGGLAAEAMGAFDVRTERTRDAVRMMVPATEGPSPSQLPFTPRAKRALELSLREALGSGAADIETEHLLLGLLRRHCTAVRVLAAGLDVDAAGLRVRLIESLPGARAGAILERSQPRIDVPDELLGPLSAEVDVLAREIERVLKRPADTGDMLLILAATPGTPAALALAKLGIDLDDLQGAIDAGRSETRASPAQSMTGRMGEIRRRLGLSG
jgi:ATP-dependent Clp protease ATP-binding subunit ClpA